MPLDSAMMGGAPPQEAPPMDPNEGGKLSKDEMLDVKIAYGMMRNLIASPKAKGVLTDSLSKPNPAPSMSILVAAMVDKIAKKMEEKGLGLSPRVWLAKGGAVERALDEVAKVAEANDLAFDDAIQSQVFAGVIDQMKIAAEADRNGEQPEEQEGDPNAMPPPGGDPAAMMGPPPVAPGGGPDPSMMGGPPPVAPGGV